MRIIGLLLWFITSVSYAQTSVTSVPDDLVSLLANQNLSVATTPDALLSGRANIALSQGVWQEPQVLAFKRKYGYLPTVLPLTITKQEGVVKAFDATAGFYLVVNFPAQGEVRESLAQQLQGLLGDDFQAQLDKGNYQALSSNLKTMWKIKLGVAEPMFTHGYL